MKSKIVKLLIAGLAMMSLCFMGCEPGEDAELPINLTVKDADGNVYPTMKMEKQIWMAKNLNVKVDGSMCYKNDPANCKKYGRLYTWEAAKTACPAGWHLPSKEEFELFLIAVKTRFDQVAQQKSGFWSTSVSISYHEHLRDSSWFSGLNSFGFAALPAGRYRSEFKVFYDLDGIADFWTSTVDVYPITWRVDLGHDMFTTFNEKADGHSVRCLQDSN